MFEDNTLTLEQELLIRTARLTVTAEEECHIKKMNLKNVNWFEFYKFAFYHKVATLCWKNIKKIRPEIRIAKYLNDILNFAYIGIGKKNEHIQSEVSCVIKALENRGITAIPVKGSFLLNKVYIDYGIRYSGDSDFLIKYEEINELQHCIAQLGYINGFYDQASEKIYTAPRESVLLWKMNMSNLFPFIKACDNVFSPICKLDFRFALDDSRSKEPINEIVSEYRNTGAVKNAHYLIHLCTHFYDEAKHDMTISLQKDLNIIKLCDIREFVLRYVTKADEEELIKFAQKFNLKEQVYYTFFHIKLVYDDDFCDHVINNIGIKNDEFLFSHGKGIFYEKPFWERFFSCDNSDEISESDKNT